MTATTELPQHLAALQQANRVRLARAALHNKVAELGRYDGARRVAGLLLDPPEDLGSLTIFDLLCWIHRVGRAQARGILRSADPVGVIRERKQVRDLTRRQREALAQFLHREYWGAP